MVLQDYFSDIDWIAVLISAVWSMVWGFAWYAPFAAGKTWMRLVNLDAEAAKKQRTPALVGAVIGALVVSISFSILTAATGIFDLMDGLLLGLIVGIGVVGPVVVSGVTFAQRPMGLIWIDGLHYAVQFAGIGLIMAWRAA